MLETRAVSDYALRLKYAIFLGGPKMSKLIFACLAFAFIGMAHADDNVVEFHIPPGTGSNPWNTPDHPVVVQVGQILRLVNDDSISHFLHTDGSPCPHGTNRFEPGQTYDCVISSKHNSSDEDIYDHDQGPDAQFYIQAN